MADLEVAAEPQSEVVKELDSKPETWNKWRDRLGKWRALCFSPEWGMRWLVYYLRGLAVFKFLELAGRLVVVVALVSWWLERNDRLENKHSQAWALIMSARGESADGGRRAALNTLARDRVPLTGVPLKNATLVDLKLNYGYLQGADFHNSTIRSSQVRNADLDYIDFSFANIKNVRFDSSRLFAANFMHAALEDIGFDATFFIKANFSGVTKWRNTFRPTASSPPAAERNNSSNNQL